MRSFSPALIALIFSAAITVSALPHTNHPHEEEQNDSLTLESGNSDNVSPYYETPVVQESNTYAPEEGEEEGEEEDEEEDEEEPHEEGEDEHPYEEPYEEEEGGDAEGKEPNQGEHGPDEEEHENTSSDKMYNPDINRQH